jgi:hypothetical protein
MRKGDGAQPRERALYYFCELIDSFFYTTGTKKIRQNATFLVVTKKEQIPQAGSGKL